MPELESKQSGQDIWTSSTTLDVSISAVDLDNSILVFSFDAGYPTSGPNLDHRTCRGVFTSTTNIRFTRSFTRDHRSPWILPKIEWIVYEFKSGELKQAVQHGEIDRTNATENVAIASTVLDDSITLVSVSTNSRDHSKDVSFTAELTSTTNLALASFGTPNTSNSYAAYQVVEFQSGDVSVQRGTGNIAAMALDTTEAISSVDTTKTLVFASSKSDHTVRGIISVSGLLNSSTELSLNRGLTSPNWLIPTDYSFEVVEFFDDVSVQYGEEVQDTSTTSSSATVSPVDTDRADIWTPYALSTNSYGTRIGGVNSMVRQDLSSSTNINFDRVSSLASVKIAWQLIEWAAANPGFYLSLPHFGQVKPDGVHKLRSI